MSNATWIDHLLIADAAAYPTIAQNFASGRGATYDGLTQTNGFHPLWMWLQVPLMLGSETPMARLWGVRALVVVTSLLAVAGWGMVVLRYSRNQVASALMCTVLGASGWSIYVLYSGMETSLVLVLMAGCYLTAYPLARQEERVSVRRAGFVGLLMGLCFLSRLDVIFFLVPFGVAMIWFLVRSGKRHTVAFAVTLLAVTTPYLVTNVMRFGSPVPVSGIVKMNSTPSISNATDLSVATLRRIGALTPAWIEDIFPVLCFVIAITGVVIVVLVYYKTLRLGPGRLILVLPIASVLHASYYFLFMRELLIPWHIYIELLAVVLALVYMPSLAKPRWSSAAVCTLVVCLIVSTMAYSWMKQKRRTDRVRSYIAAQWLEVMPPATRVAMYDGWYVQLLTSPSQHVLDLSGLVSDRNTAALAKRRDFQGILEVHEIEYVIGFRSFVESVDPTLTIEKAVPVPWNQTTRELILARHSLPDPPRLN